VGHKPENEISLVGKKRGGDHEKKKPLDVLLALALCISRNLGSLRVFGTRWTALIAIITATYRSEIGKIDEAWLPLKRPIAIALELTE
jgi:hypothetical protein